MANIKVWGRTTSANVQKVLWALAETGQDFDRVDAGGKFGGLDSAAYGEMNPNRLVPVLQDGDLTLWESSAIVRYIAATYDAGGLWPELPKDRALADQWADWTSHSFQPAWLGVFMQLVRTPPAKRDTALIAQSVEKAARMFALLDARLANAPYLGGETLTFADILAGVSLHRWTSMEFERPAFAHVDAWHKRLAERPGFVDCVCTSYDDLYARD